MSDIIQAYPLEDFTYIIEKKEDDIKQLKNLLLLISHKKLKIENRNKLISLIHPYFNENRIQNNEIDSEFVTIVNRCIEQIRN